MIYEVNEDSIDIAMPMQGTKIILFPVGEKIDMLFYCSGHAMYGCVGEVTNRMKEEGLFKLEVKLISDLKKVQRREHFRLNLAVPLMYYKWTEYEEGMRDSDAVNDAFMFVTPDWMEGMTIDLSGGGIKFVSDLQLEKNEKIVIILNSNDTALNRSYKFLCNVVDSFKLDGPAVGYATRARFMGLTEEEQEELIKFIFDMERKRISRKW